MKENGFRKIVALSAWYDLIVTAPLATPWTLKWFLAAFADLHSMLGVAGEVPAYGISLGLFANLLGSVVVVWSLVRVRNPQPWLGRYDAVARFLFSAWMAYAMAHGASLLVLAFLVPEITWGIVQSLPVRRRAELVGPAGASPLSVRP